MKTKLIKAAIVVIVVLFTLTGLRAQVVIGSAKLPEDFSALELISDAAKTGGLLLPKSAGPGALPSGWNSAAATGLMYFNTTGSGSVDIWTGSGWIVWNMPAAAATKPATAIGVANGVTIGANTAPKSYAVLEIAATNKGIRLPLINNTQRATLTATLNTDAKKAAAAGLMFFNTETERTNIYNGSVWIEN